METNKFLKRTNYASVFLFFTLTLLAIFHYHSEMNILFKIFIVCSSVALMVWTFYFIFNRDRYGLQDYFFSLLAQSILFMICVFAAKEGGYKEPN